MLPDAKVDDAVMDARKVLAQLWVRTSDSTESLSRLVAEAQAQIDTLTCLMDEAAEKKHAKIERLIGEFERVRTACAN